MKEEFSAFYVPTEKEFNDLWAKCIFVLDTNVLLNLYRYSLTAREALIDTLKILSKSDRLWVPHQVVLEYNRNRLGVISNEKTKYKSISGIIDKHLNALKDELKKGDRDRKNTHAALVVADLETVINDSQQRIKEKLTSLIGIQPDWTENDEIRTVLSDLLKGKIGIPYNKKRLEEIYKECDKRYELRIPPGYEDAENAAKKGSSKYGDTILWFQLIDYAKEKKMPVIFVTDEIKKDWWNPETEDRNDKQPNCDLIQEFTSKTGSQFYMYSTDRFLYWAEKQTGVKVGEETIAEIKQIGADKNAHLVQKGVTPEMITAIIQSPELLEVLMRQMRGEQVEATEFIKALADTKPEIASKVIKAILDMQTPVKDGDQRWRSKMEI